MTETNTAEAPLPSSQEQNGGENNGASNLDMNAMAKLLRAREESKAKANPQAEVSTPQKEESASPAEQVEETQSEAKAEQVEESTETTTEEAGEVLSNEQLKLDPKTQEKLNRRIGKEVGKTKRALQAAAKAEGEVAQLKAQLEAMKGGEKSQPNQAPQSLRDIEDLSALEKLERDAKLTVRWVDQMLDMDDFPAEGIKTADGVFSKADLKQMRMNARIALEDQIPEKKAFLQKREAERQKAFEIFPYFKDPESEEYAEAQEAKKANPWLAHVPNPEYVIGVQLLGLQKLKEMQSANGAPKKKGVVRTPMNGQAHVSSDASPSRVPSGDNTAAVSALKQQLVKKNGASEKDFAAYLKQREILKFS